MGGTQGSLKLAIAYIIDFIFPQFWEEDLGKEAR